jgi:hypothetical protein
MKTFCKVCCRDVKENAQGDLRFCQGHSALRKYDHKMAEDVNKDYKESLLERHNY